MSNDMGEYIVANSIQSSEYSYLIECGDAKAPSYLCVDQVGARIFWSSDAFNAIRFGRKIDAESFLSLITLTDVKLRILRVVEHCFDGC